MLLIQNIGGGFLIYLFLKANLIFSLLLKKFFK